MYTLVLRIIKDRRPRYIYLGPYLRPDEWDEKLCEVIGDHPNKERINILILTKRAAVNELILESDTHDKEITASQIKKSIKRSGKLISFFELAEERYKTYVQMEKYSVAESDKSRINNIRKFVNGESLMFTDIDKKFIEKFVIYLNTPKNGRKKTSQRSITNHLLLIRTLYNKAIAERIVDKKHYPFGKEKIKIRIPETHKIGLEEKEISDIIKVKLEPESPIFHARNKWLFSFYFAGMRISDVLWAKWTDIVNGRLVYRMGKNQKPVTLKVPDQVRKILKYYESQKRSEDDFIFPDMKTANLTDGRDIYRKLNTATKNTNDYLKTLAKEAKVKKNLSNHIARHAFGNIAGDKISPQMLQKLYRHSNLKTTINYQANFIHKNADDALDAVLNF